MSDASLRITVGANVDDALKNIDKFDDSLAGLQKDLKALQSTRLGITDQSALIQNNKQIETLQDNITRLKNAGTAGFDELGDAIKKVEPETNKFIEGVNSAYGGLRKLAFALPGIGIAGLIGGAVALLVEFAKDLIGASDAQDILNKSLADGASKAGGEVAELKSLSSIVTDETQSREARSAAFKKLQDQYPGYFANLSLENSSLKDIKTATDDVTNALVRQAQIQGLAAEIGKLTAEKAEKTSKSLATAFGNTSTLDKLKLLFSGAVSGVNGTGASAIAKTFEAQADAATEIQKKIDLLTDSLKKLNLEATGDKLGVKPPKVVAEKTTQDETLRFLEETKKNLEEIEKTDVRPIFERFKQSADGEFGKLNTEILKNKISKAIADGTKDAVSKNVISGLVDSLTGVGAKQANPNLSTAIDFSSIHPDPVKNFRQIEDSIDKEFQKVTFKPPTLIDPNFIFTNYGESVAKYVKRIDELTSVANAAIGNLIEGGLENLGKALGGGGLGNALTGILVLIGDALETFGKQIITAATIALLAKKALATLFANPATGIIVGALAIAAGAAIKQASATKGVKAFADGGIVTGPTLGLVGEAGPEVIFPLNKLNQFIKGSSNGGMLVTVQGEIKGNNLAIVQKRTNKLNGMV